MDAATQFGARLFEQLVSSAGVRDVYTTARHDASAAGKGLRLTLSLRAAPQLASIPWEFLYDRPRFLAQHVTSPVVRFVDLEDPPPPLRIEPPLRVLGMVSRPRDAELDALDVDEEQSALERWLRSLIDAGAVTLRWLADATLAALQQEVDHGEDFHVFHYIGHGEYDEESGHSSLILEHGDGRPRRVGGQQLGALLCDRGTLRLAVLNACEAAQTAPQDPLAGIATSLMEYGVPAVVAMQFAITDVGALTFADEFYGALAAGYAVDAAVTQARRALAADSDVEWGTPVLFMRVLDGRLFDLRPSTAATARVEPLSSTAAGAPPPGEPALAAVRQAGEIQPGTPRERTGEAVKPGDAEHTGGDPPSPPRSSRRLAWVGAVVGALAIAAAAVAIVGGGGGSGGGSSSQSIISITPQPAVVLSPSHGLRRWTRDRPMLLVVTPTDLSSHTATRRPAPSPMRRFLTATVLTHL
ncbi:MAG: CHAT domain-containing protein [Solirubrobacterales bacterium]|nr:CHAT domain-containing protein [Solirubrobacterales bacterium]